METNKIDKIFKEKLQDRQLKPSTSAWERLSVQLDEQHKDNTKSVFYYIGIVASFLLIIAIGYQFFRVKAQVENPTLEEVVIQPKDKKIINEKIDKLIHEIPVQKVLVENTKTNRLKSTDIISSEVEKSLTKKNTNLEDYPLSENLKNIDHKIVAINETPPVNETIVANKKQVLKNLKRDPKSTIKINADDLLFAVTHSPKEVEQYYAKYKIDRDDVLKSIKNELKNSKIKINPETILAEVERSIIDDDFQNNFMKTLKRKVSDIASAIASRND